MATPERDIHEPESSAGTHRVLLLGAIFAASGAAALVCQVAWQRILALHSGIGIYSVAVIVAAFLGGLGLGSYLGGRLSVRLAPRTALRTFAALELAIGAFAAASSFVYYDVLYLEAPWLFSSAWRAAPLHFALLLGPTTLMGMSLPVLVRATLSDTRAAPRMVGWLYGVNVLGAALGAAAAPWILMRLVGIRGALAIAGAASVLAGLTALLLARGSASPRPAEEVPAPPDGLAEPAGSRPLSLWIALYALSGMCALSLEILWFRVIDVAVKSTAFTFGTVLAVYLLGLGTGSLAGARLAVRVARPLRAFLLCQCVLLAYAGASLYALASAPPDWPVYRELMRVWAQYEDFRLGQVADWPRIALLYGVLPVGLYGPPTFLMGLSFTILQRAVHDERRTAGLKVGVLQAANILGNVAGSLLTGLILLDTIGTSGTLRCLLGAGLVFAALGIRHYGWRGGFLAPAAVLAALLLALPAGDRLWPRLHGVAAEQALVAEDATGVVAITQDPQGHLRVSVNGKGHSWLPYGGIHTKLGVLPAAMHPAPHEVAVIGLGSGDTAWAAAFRQETERVSVFELSASQRSLLERVPPQPWLGGLRRFLEDRRVAVITADGRNALATGTQTYDVIEADALRPHSAYAGNVYSMEFFRLCASRLKTGGLMCSWIPTRRTYATFCEVFPHVVEFAEGEILVGSNEPIALDVAAWSARLETPHARAYFGRALADFLPGVVRTALPAAPGLQLSRGINRDLFPRDEFLTPAHR